MTGSWGLGAKWRYLHGHPAYQRSPLPTVLRLAEWRCRCALRISGTVRLQHNVRLRLPPNWRGVAKLLYAFGEAYEPELKYMAAMLRPGMVVVDVGASYGVYAAVAAKAVGPAGLVLAFEPATEAFRILENNLELNGLGNVRPFRCALANTAGRARLAHHPDPSRNALCANGKGTANSEEVAVETLDGVAAREGIQRVDVLKIDAEGSEEMVLAGAGALLARCRPLVIFEVNRDAGAALGLHPLGAWRALESLGYQLYSIDGDGGLSTTQPPPACGNVVAVHGENRCGF